MSCCSEHNVKCCEICDCTRYSSPNNSIQIDKTGCDVKLQLTPNTLQNLLNIPSSGCITVLKEIVDGKLIFTPTFNTDCLTANEVILTADNGLHKDTPTNVRLGGSLVEDTAIDTSDYTFTISKVVGDRQGFESWGGLPNAVAKVIYIKDVSDDLVNFFEVRNGLIDFEISSLTDRNNSDPDGANMGYYTGGIVSATPTYTLFAYHTPQIVDPGNTPVLDDPAKTARLQASEGLLDLYAALVNVTGHLVTDRDATIFGLTAGRGNGGNNSNSAFGIDVLKNNTGILNSGFGYNALKSNLAGGGNAAFGYNSLGANTGGNYCTAIGYSTLSYNIGASFNTAVGALAQSQATGGQNVALGYNTMVHVTGNENVALGNYALNQATTCGGSVGIGHKAGNDGVGATFNVLIGSYAAENNLDGSYNVVIGRSARRNATTGNTSVAIGFESGILSEGDGNVLIGHQAGYALTSEDNILAISNSQSKNLIAGDFSAGQVQINAAAIPVFSPCAALEIIATDKGLLLPRMTKVERNLITSPTEGLVIYQTDNTPGIRVYNGTNWMRFTETID